MQDREKTRSQLLAEIAQLRQRLAELERVVAVAGDDERTFGHEPETFRPLLEDGPVLMDAGDAERQRRERQHYAELLVDTIPDAITVTDLDGRIERFNREFIRRYDLDEKQICGRTPAELAIVDAEQWRHIHGQVIARLWDERTVGNVEITSLHSDGTSFPTLSSYSFLRNPSGQPIGVIGVEKDITQIKEAERLASEKEQLIRATFDAITESVLLVDRRGVFRAVNRTAAERLGCLAEDMVGTDSRNMCLATVPTSIWQVRLSHFERVVETGTPLRLVDERAGRSFDQTYYPVFDEAGEVSHVVIFAADITARITAQRELEESWIRYHELMENVSDIIYSSDREGIMTSISQAAKRLLGFEPEEILGTHYRQWIPEDQLPQLEAARRTALQGDRTVVEVVIGDREGHRHHMEISVSPIVTKGEVSGTQGIIRDITKRRQVDRVIRANQERLSGLFNAVTESVLLTDPEGTLLVLNETASQHLGRSREELVGANLADVAPEGLSLDALNNRLQWIRRVVQTGQAMRIEESSAGQTFDHNLYPVLDTHGQVRQIAVFSKDVSAQRRAEIALCDSEAKYRSLVEGVVDVILALDCDGCVRWANHVVKDMLGYELDEVVGKPVSDFVLKDVREPIEARLRRVLDGNSVRSETILLARDGTLIHAEYSAAPVVEEGRIAGIQCVVWDVTQRKRLECKLRESEARYRTLVENAGEAIATVDHDGVFLFMNATAARRLGDDLGNLIGKTMWDLFPQEIADRQMAQIRRVLETGQGHNAIALSQVQGERRWYNTTIEPLRDSSGTVVSGLVIARDIHEFKMAQDELEAYREKMIRAEQLASVGTLSATMAHELTQPLTVIRLSIQNSLKDLEQVACPARVIEDLKDGLMEVSSVTAIAERFRNFARRSAERMATKVAVHMVVEHVINLLRESARRSKVVLQADGLAQLPSLYIPEKDLEQLVFALVQNAIQAADGQKNAQFRITGAQKDGRVELQFADDCGGIAAENLPRVFEPFFTTKPAGEGTGLGLCIVQRVVSDAHGRLQVKTDFGHGTTFIVTLPVPED